MTGNPVSPGDLDVRLPQQRRVYLAGGPGQKISRAGSLREGDHLTDRRFSGQQHDEPVQPQGDPAVRRSAVLQGVKKEAKPRLSLLGRDVQQAEDLFLQRPLVDSDAPAAQLDAVEDEVMRLRPDAAGRRRARGLAPRPCCRG